MNGNKPANLLDTIDVSCVLFLDVETVPAYASFDEVPEQFQDLWVEKSRKYSYEQKTPAELYFDKAAIHAEFGKIVCISIGFRHKEKDADKENIRIKSFAGENEAELLMQLKELMDRHYNDCNRHYLCAHNGIEFDFPYIARRMLIHGIRLPNLLNVSGSKSWSNKWLLDTMDLWRFGDYKEKTSLNLLAACFGIESPKDDISGKDVARVFYHERNVERIQTYCQKDVRTLIHLFCRMAALSPVPDEDVIYL
jgi:DNA polymerase elongation subunit (family B)